MKEDNFNMRMNKKVHREAIINRRNVGQKMNKWRSGTKVV